MAEDLKHLIWIDPNIDNSENQGYLSQIKSLGFSKIKAFRTTEEGINYIKSLQFESTKIILSGRLYIEFIKKFKKNITNLYIIPKILVFTRNKGKFLEQNKNFLDTINNPFYNYGGINVDFDLVKDFLNTIIFMNEIKISNINETYENNKEIENLNNKEKLGIYKNKDNIQLTFEYIDCLEKLELPILYQSIINVNKIDKIENYNEYLYSKYSNQNN